MKKILLLLLVPFSLTTCERDDICSETVVTPRLLMEFFDNLNTESPKNVQQFRVQGVGNEAVLDGYDIVTASSIELPLKTDAMSTSYSFYKDYEIDDNGTPDDTTDDFNTGNEDIVTISYTTEEVFVSRACGFKTIFKNLSISIEDDGNNWIQNIIAVNDNQTIENEAAAHYNLFH